MVNGSLCYCVGVYYKFSRDFLLKFNRHLSSYNFNRYLELCENYIFSIVELVKIVIAQHYNLHREPLLLILAIDNILKFLGRPIKNKKF